jgi:hypothetical protein
MIIVATGVCCSTVQLFMSSCPLIPSHPADTKPLLSDAGAAVSTSVCRTEDGLALEAGAVWRRDACTSCACTHNTSMQCHTQQCPSLDCARLLYIKGQCCPLCAGVPPAHVQYACMCAQTSWQLVWNVLTMADSTDRVRSGAMGHVRTARVARTVKQYVIE